MIFTKPMMKITFKKLTPIINISFPNGHRNILNKIPINKMEIEIPTQMAPIILQFEIPTYDTFLKILRKGILLKRAKPK